MSLAQASSRIVAREVNRHHAQVASQLSGAVQSAIAAGGVLCEARTSLAGSDEQWVEENCDCSLTTAWRHMRLHRHRANLSAVKDLQDAYRTVAQLETAGKQEQRREQQERIDRLEETGEKPAGWDRATEYQHRKQRETVEIPVPKLTSEMRCCLYQHPSLPNPEN